jgi:hypothetical protein
LAGFESLEATMNANIATEITRPRVRRAARSLAVLSFGPLAIAAGVGWALFQPWRVTLLHPHGQGFWWLVVEPPILVVLAGLVFHLVIAPGVVSDLEEAEP